MRSFFILLILAGIGCGSGAPAGGGSADMAGGARACRSPADCRLYSSYCSTNPCVCVALGAREVDPPCPSGQQSCVVDPCAGKRVDCVGGGCVVK